MTGIEDYVPGNHAVYPSQAWKLTIHFVFKKSSLGEGLRSDVKKENWPREDQPQHPVNARRPCLYFT